MRQLLFASLLLILGCSAPKGGTAGPVEFSSGHDSSGQMTTSTGDVFNLHVQGVTDSDLSEGQRIVEGLRSSTLLASLLPTVNISVERGKVLLRGIVQNQQQKEAIESTVQRTAGIKNVVRELQISNRP